MPHEISLEVVLLTIPAYMDRARATHRHLIRDVKFPNVRIFTGVTAATSAQEDVHLAINQTHYNAVQQLATMRQPTPCYPLFVEDDCRFVYNPQGNTVALILQAIQFLETFDPSWHILLLGHCPLGPVEPIRIDPSAPVLCRTMFPFSSICYIVNPHMLPQMLYRVPDDKWQRPWMVEGWLAIPWQRKYAFLHSLTTMGQTPKEVQHVPVINQLDLTAAVWTLSDVATKLGPFLMLLWRVLAFFARLWFHYSITSSTPGLDETALACVQTGDLILCRHRGISCLELVMPDAVLAIHAGIVYRDPVSNMVYVYHMHDVVHSSSTALWQPQPLPLLLEPLQHFVNRYEKDHAYSLILYNLDARMAHQRRRMEQRLTQLISAPNPKLYTFCTLNIVWSLIALECPAWLGLATQTTWTQSQQEQSEMYCLNVVCDVYAQIGVMHKLPRNQIIQLQAFAPPCHGLPFRAGFSFRQFVKKT